jgi:hypothetical protein
MSELGMYEKNLDGAQLGAGPQPVCCEPLPQGVRRQWRRHGFSSWEPKESNQRYDWTRTSALFRVKEGTLGKSTTYKTPVAP